MLVHPIELGFFVGHHICPNLCANQNWGLTMFNFNNMSCLFGFNTYWLWSSWHGGSLLDHNLNLFFCTSASTFSPSNSCSLLQILFLHQVTLFSIASMHKQVLLLLPHAHKHILYLLSVLKQATLSYLHALTKTYCLLSMLR